MKNFSFIVFLVFSLLIISSPLNAAENNYHSNFNFYEFLQFPEDYLINYKIKNMSLEEKVGQLFQVGFHSKTVDKKIKNLIKNYHVGGVIYFGRNLENLEQIKLLSKTLQNLALSSGAKMPLFIAVDQEGGRLRRIKDLTYYPANAVFGAAGKEELIRKAAAVTAKELKNIGINVNLAPVLDVNNNPNNTVIGDRSFGSDPKLVARMGTAYIEGLQSQGLIATAKHFPGHGDTRTDSHFDLPVIAHDKSRLDRIELYPFKKAIEAGVESIMTTHIYFSAIEEEAGIPATLSKLFLSDILRKELKFKGIIITDCMEMGAISNSFGTVEGSLRAIKAGADIVLISHSYDQQKKAIKFLLKAVYNGEISEKRIDKSLRRIIKLKIEKFLVLNE